MRQDLLEEAELTNAGLRVAGPTLFYHPLANAILGLTRTAANLDSTATFITALGPAAPSVPAPCEHNTQRSTFRWSTSASTDRLHCFLINVISLPNSRAEFSAFSK